MLGWLTKKGDDARVYMCIKEVLWELESSDTLKRAKILALNVLFRTAFVTDAGFPRDVFDNAPRYPRSDLVKLYGAAEDLRNRYKHMQETLGQWARKRDVAVPNDYVQEIQLNIRAIEVVMCTIGAGVAVNRRDDIKNIWRMLYDSKAHALVAIEQLKTTEIGRLKMSWSDEPAMFANVDSANWADSCNSFPSYLAE